MITHPVCPQCDLHHDFIEHAFVSSEFETCANEYLDGTLITSGTFAFNVFAVHCESRKNVYSKGVNRKTLGLVHGLNIFIYFVFNYGRQTRTYAYVRRDRPGRTTAVEYFTVNENRPTRRSIRFLLRV